MSNLRSGEGFSRDQVQALVGRSVWDPEVGYGSFLTLNFGAPRLDSQGVQKGEYYLWVYGSWWVLRDGEVVLATADQCRANMESAIIRLDGVSVVSAEIGSGGSDLSIAFEKGLVLNLTQWENSDPDDTELWMLYLPDGTVLIGRTGGDIVRERADQA